MVEDDNAEKSNVDARLVASLTSCAGSNIFNFDVDTDVMVDAVESLLSMKYCAPLALSSGEAWISSGQCGCAFANRCASAMSILDILLRKRGRKVMSQYFVR